MRLKNRITYNTRKVKEKKTMINSCIAEEMIYNFQFLRDLLFEGVIDFARDEDIEIEYLAKYKDEQLLRLDGMLSLMQKCHVVDYKDVSQIRKKLCDKFSIRNVLKEVEKEREEKFNG